MGQLHFECFLLSLSWSLVLLVCAHKGGKDTVLLVQQGLGLVVLQDDPPLHHNHQVGIQDGVDAVLRQKHTRDVAFYSTYNINSFYTECFLN